MPSWILVDANVYPTYRLVFLFSNINSIDYVETNANIILNSIEYLTFYESIKYIIETLIMTCYLMDKVNLIYKYPEVDLLLLE